MEQLLSLFVRSIFVDNMIFAFFLGMCSYLAASKNVKTAVGLGIAVTFVLIVTLPVNYLLQTKVLAANAIIEGVDLSFLSFILFIAVIAGIVQLVEMVVERFSPSLYASLGRSDGDKGVDKSRGIHKNERLAKCLASVRHYRSRKVTNYCASKTLAEWL